MAPADMFVSWSISGQFGYRIRVLRCDFDTDIVWGESSAVVVGRSHSTIDVSRVVFAIWRNGIVVIRFVNNPRPCCTLRGRVSFGIFWSRSAVGLASIWNRCDSAFEVVVVAQV